MLQGLKGLYLLHQASRNRATARLLRAEAMKYDPRCAIAQANTKMADKLEEDAEVFVRRANGK